MNESEQMRRMEEELNMLQQELEGQQRKISELRERLSAMGNGERFPKTTQSTGRKNLSWSLENFIGLRLIHFIGIIVLVIGLSIGVKYAIDQDLISEGMRIILAYGAGVALYF